jgi:hypothetical protein
MFWLGSDGVTLAALAASAKADTKVSEIAGN